MDVRGFQIQVAAGTVMLRVLRPSQAQAELDTPSVAVRALRAGRLSHQRPGRRNIRNHCSLGRSRDLQPARQRAAWASGRTMNARGPASDPEFQVRRPIASDTWDRWNEDRDRYLQRSRSYEHVSPDVPGVEDLDQNGRWTNDPTYGQVWQPNVAPGLGALSKWPLGLGRLLWLDLGELRSLGLGAVSLWPLVLGRWRLGLVSGSDVWASLLGAGLCRLLRIRRRWIGVGFGFGGVGWVALAPFEVFHPWWGRGFYGGFRGGGFGAARPSSTTRISRTRIAMLALRRR